MIAEKIACLFFMLVALVGILVFGTPGARNVAIIAALFAGYSQYAVQDFRRIAQLVSIAMAYIALILLIIAIYLLPW